MITRDNIEFIIDSMTDKDKKRISKSNKEYVVIYLHVFNAGSAVEVKLTNDFNRYKNVSKNGHAVMELSEAQEMLGQNL